MPIEITPNPVKYWTQGEITSKLSQITNVNKKSHWIRWDLSVSESNWFTRLIWTVVAKFFHWMRTCFYKVDLDKSRALLEQLRGRICNEFLYDRINDFNAAVKNFNTIAPRHKVSSIVDYPIPSSGPKADYLSLALPKEIQNTIITDFSLDDLLKMRTVNKIFHTFVGNAPLDDVEIRKTLGERISSIGKNFLQNQLLKENHPLLFIKMIEKIYPDGTYNHFKPLFSHIKHYIDLLDTECENDLYKALSQEERSNCWEIIKKTGQMSKELWNIDNEMKENSSCLENIFSCLNEDKIDSPQYLLMLGETLSASPK